MIRSSQDNDVVEILQFNWVEFTQKIKLKIEIISASPSSPSLRSKWRSVDACRGKQEDKITFVSNWLILLPPRSIGCEIFEKSFSIHTWCWFNLFAAETLSSAASLSAYVGQVLSLCIYRIGIQWLLSILRLCRVNFGWLMFTDVKNEILTFKHWPFLDWLE